MSKPSDTLLLAKALYAQNEDLLRDIQSRREVSEAWKGATKKARLYWRKKARRILVRWQALRT